VGGGGEVTVSYEIKYYNNAKMANTALGGEDDEREGKGVPERKRHALTRENELLFSFFVSRGVRTD